MICQAISETLHEQVLFLADILPTAYEVGVLNGMVSPGDVVAIVGAGPIGLAAILTATLYTPGRIVAIDLDLKQAIGPCETGFAGRDWPRRGVSVVVGWLRSGLGGVGVVVGVGGASFEAV